MSATLSVLESGAPNAGYGRVIPVILHTLVGSADVHAWNARADWSESSAEYLARIRWLEVGEFLGVADCVDEIDLAVADAERDGAHDLSAPRDEHSRVTIDVSDCELGSEAGDCGDQLGSDGLSAVDFGEWSVRHQPA